MLDDAVDPDFGQHQRHGRLGDFGDDAARRELRQSGVAAEVDHRRRVERTVGVELLGLEPVGLEVGGDPFRRGRDERKSVGGGDPGVALGVLCNAGDFVARESVPERVASESLLRVVAQQSSRARTDPERTVFAAIEAGGAAQGCGDHAVGRFDTRPGVELPGIDGVDTLSGHGGQHRGVVEPHDILYVALFEPGFLQPGPFPEDESRTRGGPYPPAGVFAESVDKDPVGQQRVAADVYEFRGAHRDPVVDVGPQPPG